MKQKIAYLIVLSALFISCDCYQNASGIIVDNETHKPINKVKIKELNKNFIDFTDENGYFERHHISGGIFTCPDIIIIVSKEKYETDTIVFKNGEDKLIKLMKVK
jgi:hypothetical protein